jgi:hypothetical protein
LFEENIRLAMKNMGFFMDFELVWLRHEGPLGNMELMIKRIDE